MIDNDKQHLESLQELLKKQGVDSNIEGENAEVSNPYKKKCKLNVLDLNDYVVYEVYFVSGFNGLFLVYNHNSMCIGEFETKEEVLERITD